MSRSGAASIVVERAFDGLMRTATFFTGLVFLIVDRTHRVVDQALRMAPERFEGWSPASG